MPDQAQRRAPRRAGARSGGASLAGSEAGQAAAVQEGGPRRRVSFLTDLPTPYMLEVLDALAEMVELTVIFSAPTGSRALPWAWDRRSRFRHRVLGGLTITSKTPGRPDYHLDPRTLTALASARPDAVISAGFSIPTAYAAAYARMRRIPLIIYSDGTAHYERGLRRHQRLARSVLLRRASACVAKSRPAAKRFLQLGVPADKVFLAPHSSTLEPLWQVARRREYRDRERLTVMTAARLVPHKGVDRLLRAAGRVEVRERLRLVVAGSGPEEPRLKAMARQLGLDARFCGFVPHERMPAMYAEADVFAFPTFEDPFGIAVLEAGAAGLPLVSSHHAGASWDLIAGDEGGVIVDPDDTDGFAGALSALAADPALRMRLGRNAHRATLRRSPLDSARGYVAAVESSLGAGRAGSR